MSKYKSKFDKRLEENIDELKWLYMELYHNDYVAFEYFIEMLRRNWKERKLSLRKIDDERLANPDWYHSSELMGMMMYSECFGGTLKGVKDNLDYVEECGVNYLHLMPLLDSPEGKSDGGYAVSDFRKVRPDLGTMEDLEALAKECHKRGMMLCLDFVLNHTSEDHEWARAARAGDLSAQSRYFMYDNWDIPNAYSENIPEVFPETAPGHYTYYHDCNKIVMTQFYPFQWDLNYANPMVFNDMADNVLFLANKGLDVVRLDAVPYIWKQMGTNCRNLPQVHTLVRMFKLACKIVCPSVLLLGEVVMEPKEVVPYFGTQEKTECDILYNVTTMCTIWHTLATKNVSLLNSQVNTIADLPLNCVFQNYLRCHDDVGWGLDYGFLSQFGIGERSHKKYLNDWFTGKWYGSPARGELYNDSALLGDARLCGTTASLCGIEAAEYERNEDLLAKSIEADLMLHAWMLTMKGIPVLYSGDEIGMLNDYDYHNDPKKWDDSRYIHRGRFNWELAEGRNNPDTVAGKIFGGIAKLVKIRKENDIFSNDAHMYAIHSGDDRVLAVVKEYKDEKFIGLFNFSDQFCRTYIESNEWIDMLDPSREVICEATPSSEYVLEPYGFRWFLHRPKKEEPEITEEAVEVAEETVKQEVVEKKAPTAAKPAKSSGKQNTKAKSKKKA